MAQDTNFYDRLREAVDRIPVVDCHEHMQGPSTMPAYKEPIASLAQGYISSDLHSAGFGVTDREIARLQDVSVSTDDKWPLFEKLWKSTEHTAYARVTKYVLREVYGVDELTRRTLYIVAEKLSDHNEESYFGRISDAGIKALLVDVLGGLEGGLGSFLDGTVTFPDIWRPLISLPGFHPNTFTRGTVDDFANIIDTNVTSLDRYLEVVHELMMRCIKRGAIGIKDQSAYSRIVSYDLATRSDAERLFNRAISDGNNAVGWPESKPLGDYLFHRFMEFAAELELPVQLHTGHMAGIRNHVDKTNVAFLANVFDLHRNVRFDIFHGNWPYLGDLLFIGKNYPNVALDCCWLHIIDPAYSVELLERATLTLPHTKVHGFGGDYGDVPEFVVGHLDIARDNITRALIRLIESRWVSEDAAIDLAVAWLFENPNRFFGLDLEG